MAEQKRRDLLSSLDACLQRFRLESRKLVAPFLNSSVATSEPAFIDEEDLEKLQAKLTRIRATLKDAEKLAISDDSVKLWLCELRDIECAAEDVLEVIRYGSLWTTRFQELVSNSTGKRKREVSLFRFSPRSRLNIKINKIFEKFKEIADDRKALRLREEDGIRRLQALPRPPSTSLSEGKLFGREEDLNQLFQLLISTEPKHSIIPVVGMAGVGKTALVQHLYNRDLKKHFDEKIWICASQDFDVVKITRTMIQALRGETRDIYELSLLHEMLKELLEGKRVLLVFDDMWSEDAQHWEMIQLPLLSAAPGSKIIVTLQNTNAAKKLWPNFRDLCLKCLSDDDCWLICRRYAFDGHDLNVHTNLVEIGKTIAAKCKGLPLAAKAVGCLLRSAVDEERWENVLQSDLWADDEMVNRISPALRLTYDRLPMHLKRCFAYCSLFPKGYIFEKNQLVRLWIAQGFAESDQPSQIEERGNRYFDDLAGRSFFHISPFYDFSEERYMMHDLFHELAQSVSGKECSRTEDYKLCKIGEGARHSSLVPQESHFKTDIQIEPSSGQYLRTLLFIGRLELKLNTDPFRVNISGDLFHILECLRSLDSSNTDIQQLPASIGNLIHLRYLGLRNTKIERLPESVCFLFNLQTLDLNHCCYLEELPEGAKHLFNLRHLELPVMKSSNVRIASGIGQLTSLQTLPVVVKICR